MSGSKSTKILLIVLGLAMVGGLVFVYLNGKVPGAGIKTEEFTPDTKLYRNEEFGFEFEYPQDWSFEIDSFRSPSSKLNLQGNSSVENYNPLVPHVLINVVTSDFADKAVVSRQRRGAAESDVVIDATPGKKFQYKTDYSEKISFDFPLGEYRMIFALEIINGLDSNREYVSIFNQILSSFKFLDKEE
jgi:hypothetical protein